MQKIHDLHEALLRLILPGDILKAHAGLSLHVHLRRGLPDTHDPAGSAPHPAHHKIHRDKEEDKGNHKTDHSLHDEARIVRLLPIDLHLMLIESLHKLPRIGIDRHDEICPAPLSAGGFGAALLPGRTALPRALLRIDGDLTVPPLYLLDLILFHHREELAVALLLRVRHRKEMLHHRIDEEGQHSGDDQNQKGLPRTGQTSSVSQIVFIHALSLCRKRPRRRGGPNL